MTLHAGAEQTDGRYDFTVATVEPGPGVIPLYVHHEHDEAIYVLEGNWRCASATGRRRSGPDRSS